MIKWLKKRLPDQEEIKSYRCMKIFGKLLHRTHLWHFHKPTVAKGLALGLFIAFIPLPFQTILAAIAALLFDANLPVTIAGSWITNPLTIPPMFYFCYRVGATILETGIATISVSEQGLMHGISQVWQPLLLGCFITGILASTLGYCLVYLLWPHSGLWRWFQNKKTKK